MVKPAPIASMLETTKLSVATVAALLNRSINIDVSRIGFGDSCAVDPSAQNSRHDHLAEEHAILVSPGSIVLLTS